MKIEEFIAARIAEEKRIAQAACQEPWVVAWPGTFLRIGDLTSAFFTHDNLGVVDPPDVEHMVLQQPKNTLARVEALEALAAVHTPEPGDYCCDDIPCLSARHIAAIWRDHEDYREEWRP